MVYSQAMNTDIQLQPQPIDIKSLILNIRGTQVLLDSDVATLYGYETKYINRTASRNKARFPEAFRFQLTKEEVDGIERLRCKNGTSNNVASGSDDLRFQDGTSNTSQRGGRRYRPFVFSEQGIAMLSGLLKNETAVQVSIGIMNAFVEMRKFIAAYGSTFERLTSVEFKLLEHDKKFDEVFNLIQLPGLPKQGIFMKGQIFDAYNLILDIFKSAKRRIVVFDNYVDDSVLKMLAEKAAGVDAVIVTAKPGKIASQHVDKFNQQYPTLKLIEQTDIHDRFIVVDDDTVYHVGASLKDLGKKCFGITVLEDTDAKNAILRKLQAIHQSAQPAQPNPQPTP